MGVRDAAVPAGDAVDDAVDDAVRERGRLREVVHHRIRLRGPDAGRAPALLHGRKRAVAAAAGPVGVARGGCTVAGRSPSPAGTALAQVLPVAARPALRTRGVLLAGTVLTVLLAVLVGVGAAVTREAPSSVVPLPVFPTTSSAAAPAPAGGSAGPVDCGSVLPAEVVTAVLGQPLDSITSRTTVGAPSPSVGRLARTTCRYTATADTDRLHRGERVLDLALGTYTDPQAALAHWRVNSDAERDPGGRAEELQLGAARAVYAEHPGEAVLLVVHDSTTATLAVDPGTAPRGAPRDLLVDLALRVLAAASPQP